MIGARTFLSAPGAQPTPRQAIRRLGEAAWQMDPRNVTNRANARYPAWLPLVATVATQRRHGVQCRWFLSQLKPRDARILPAEVEAARFHARPGASGKRPGTLSACSPLEPFVTFPGCAPSVTM